LPEPAELEAAGAVIGEIIFDKQSVFDLSNPEEDNWLYRLANRLHVITRDSVIRNQLLFRPGDRFSARILEESARLLRKNRFFYDVRVEPARYENGVVDIRVWTRDIWTLIPGLSLSRSGGENRSGVTLSENNLLGHGVSLSLRYSHDVDRESVSFAYFDRNLGRSWTSLFLGLADNSDGKTTDVRINRPFYELDARWSAGVNYRDDSREVSFYDLGNEMAEYAEDANVHSTYIGWSNGLRDGWVRRWVAGFVYDAHRFDPVTDGTLAPLVPEDRKLVYPYLGFELLEDRFESTANRDLIDRTEDFFMGTRLWASLGYAAESFGSDRESLLYRFEASHGFGSIQSKALLVSTAATGRVDDGTAANQEFMLDASYYNKINDKRLSFVTLRGSLGNDLDLDNLVELGGDNGLRGYPLRYQTGDSKVLLTVEQRYYTDWYPFRLFRVGGAVFADAGRVWGDNPIGGPQLGWLKDVGFGLRLLPTRASGRDVIHIDIAFPLDGDPSIDKVQFLIETKSSF